MNLVLVSSSQSRKQKSKHSSLRSPAKMSGFYVRVTGQVRGMPHLCPDRNIQSRYPVCSVKNIQSRQLNLSQLTDCLSKPLRGCSQPDPNWLNNNSSSRPNISSSGGNRWPDKSRSDSNSSKGNSNNNGNNSSSNRAGRLTVAEEQQQ